jgi:hypothetical protein
MTDEGAPNRKRVYIRKLSSGGYVAIEARPVRTLFGPDKIRGELIVERRAEERRAGHVAPIAACTEHTDLNVIIDALSPIADSDETIADVLRRKVMVAMFGGRRTETRADS